MEREKKKMPAVWRRRNTRVPIPIPSLLVQLPFYSPLQFPKPTPINIAPPCETVPPVHVCVTVLCICVACA